MLRRTLLGVALTALLAPLAQAQTADDVIAKNIQARGGMDKLKAVKSVRMSGKMMMGPGMEAPMVLELERPNKMRMEFTVQGMTGVQAFDGKTAWMMMPFLGKKDPEAVPAEDAKEFEDQADMDGPLVEYKAKGHQVELVGKEPVEGTDAYKLKITMKNGNIRYIYVDAENYLEIRTESKRMVRGTEMELEGTPGDYKQIEGVMFPFSMENGMKGNPQKSKLTMEKIEINPTLAASRFTMPAASDTASIEVTKAMPVKAVQEKASGAKRGAAKVAVATDSTQRMPVVKAKASAPAKP